MGRNTIDLRRLSGTPFPFKSRETLLRTALHKTFTWTVILSLGLLFSFAHAIPSKISSAEDSRIFSNPNIMVSVGGDFAYKADLAVDQFGRLYAAWIDHRNGFSDIFFSMSVDGGYTWSNNVMVNTAPQASWGWQDQYNPTIATDGKNVYVAWMDCRNNIDLSGGCGGPYDVYMDWSPVDDINFTTDDIFINTDGTIPVDSSAMSMTADENNVYLVWPGVKDGRWDVFLDWSASGSIDFTGHRARVTSDVPDSTQVEPDVASDGINIYVAWRDFRDQKPGVPQSDIYFDWSPIADIDFSSPDMRLGSDFTPGLRRDYPSVATDRSNIYVAWSDNRSTVPGDDADTWVTWSPVDNISFVSPDIRVNNCIQNAQGMTSIASDGETLYAVWNDNREPMVSWDDVYFNMAPADNLNFSHPDVKVNDDFEPYNQMRPILGIHDDGQTTHIFVIWEDDRFGAPSGMAIMFAASPPYPLYPDLSLNESDISISTSEPVQNTEVALNATIHNLGEMGVPIATITFYDGNPSLNQTIGESKISVLAHNETYVQTNWTPLLPGDYEIYVVADSYDVVNESNESNNVAKAGVSVLPHRPPTLLGAILSGMDFENVTISWSLSPDDGNGSNPVIGYKIYRKTTYDPDGLGYSVVSTLPNGTSEFTDSLSGEGNPDDYFYRVCSIDFNSSASCAKDQAGKFTRPLIKGTTLLSAPLIQSDESVETVLQTVEFDKAWVYDSSSEKWKWYMTFKPYKGELITVNETQGFWVNVTNDCNFTIAGIVPFETTIALDRGWNLISFPSFTESYTVADLRREVNATIRVEGFSPSNEPYRLMVMQETDALEAGYGYWINVAESTSWSTFN